MSFLPFVRSLLVTSLFAHPGDTLKLNEAIRGSGDADEEGHVESDVEKYGENCRPRNEAIVSELIDFGQWIYVSNSKDTEIVRLKP